MKVYMNQRDKMAMTFCRELPWKPVGRKHTESLLIRGFSLHGFSYPESAAAQKYHVGRDHSSWQQFLSFQSHAASEHGDEISGRPAPSARDLSRAYAQHVHTVDAPHPVVTW